MTSPQESGEYGFVALWDKTPAEYVASTRDEWQTTQRIQQAFANGRQRGNVTYGLFNTRWSSSYAYMTFWRAPDFVGVSDTIRELEAAGDFKFADSLHVVGRAVEKSLFFRREDLGQIPTCQDGADYADRPVALWVRWSTRESRSRAWTRVPNLSRVLKQTNALLLGEYATRWSTATDRFAFLVAPNVSAASSLTTGIRRAADLSGVHVTLIPGILDRYYRFGVHLQTEFPWLTDKDVS